jgi:hypothetical protein
MKMVFENSRKSMSEATVLRYFDFAEPVVIQTDALFYVPKVTIMQESNHSTD